MGKLALEEEAVTGGYLKRQTRPLKSRRKATGSRAALRKYAPPLIAILVLFGFWELGARTKFLNPFIVPSPVHTLQDFAKFLTEPQLWSAVRVSGIETLVGFAVGATVGLLVGAGAIASQWVRTALLPYVVWLQNIPRIALAPLFLIWFGYGLTSKAMIAAAICFFPVVINTMIGLQASQGDQLTVVRSYGASAWQRLTLLEIPAALPYIIAGLKTAATLALSGAIVAEFVSSYDGLGFLLVNAAFSLDAPRAFSVLIVLAVEGAILFGLLDAWERRVLTRRAGPIAT